MRITSHPLRGFHFESGAELEYDDGEHLYVRIDARAYDRLRGPSPIPVSRRVLVSG